MKFEKRIRALESKLLSDPIILYFADGSTRELRGPRDLLLRLFLGVCRGTNLSPEQAVQLDLINKSVAVAEPGGGHLSDVLRCALNRPAEGHPEFDESE